MEYLKGQKGGETVLLNKLVKITGYSRKHLMETLSHPVCKRRIKRQRKSLYFLVFKPRVLKCKEISQETKKTLIKRFLKFNPRKLGEK